MLLRRYKSLEGLHQPLLFDFRGTIKLELTRQLTQWATLFYGILAYVAKAGRRMDGNPKFPTLDALFRFIEIGVEVKALILFMQY